MPSGFESRAQKLWTRGRVCKKTTWKPLKLQDCVQLWVLKSQYHAPLCTANDRARAVWSNSGIRETDIFFRAYFSMEKLITVAVTPRPRISVAEIVWWRMRLAISGDPQCTISLECTRKSSVPPHLCFYRDACGGFPSQRLFTENIVETYCEKPLACLIDWALPHACSSV